MDYLLKPVQAARLQKTVSKLQLALARPAQPTIDFEVTLSQLRDLMARDLTGQQPPTGPGTAPLLQIIQANVNNVQGRGIHMVPLDEVLCFEAADKYVRVLTAQREYLIRTPLRELQAQLDAQVFW